MCEGRPVRPRWMVQRGFSSITPSADADKSSGAFVPNVEMNLLNMFLSNTQTY